jgi:hydrogenase maturation protease
VRVICVGNRWRGDDGVGSAVAARLRAQGVDVDELAGEPAGLIDAWAGAECVIVVDAVSSGAEPGLVHRVDATAGPLPVEVFGASTHLLGLGEAVELARALGRLPERLVVLGVEGKSFAAGEELSPEVAAAVGDVVEAVQEEAAACTSAR